jgi:4-amino-4-deoxy-L-arabinose transferase-like glycosyltransferase
VRLERALLLGCLAAYLLAGLFGRGLWKADEPYSFGMVWNFLTTPDWLVPRVGTAPFMEKPPLMYWTGALTARRAAPWLSAPDGARLAVLGWMLVTLAALAWLTERLLPGRRREAVLALLGMLGVVQHSHLLIADVPQLAGATLGLAGLAAHLHDNRRPWRHGLLSGSGLGIAFMSKGLLMPGVLGLTGLLGALCWPRRLFEPEGRRWLLAASLAALPWLLVWPALLWHRAPELFHTWLWTNNIGRFFGLEARNSDTDGLASSLADLLALSFPTGLILLGATLWQLYRRGGSPLKRLGRHPGLATVVLYALVCLAVLLKSAVFRSLYLLPLFPALALLAARLQPLPALAALGRTLGLAFWTPVIALLALGGFGLALGWPLPWPALVRDHLPLGERLPVGPLAWSLALLALAGWSLALSLHRRLAPSSLWFVGLTVSWSLANSLWLPWVDLGNSYARPFTELQRVLPSTRCVASYGLGESERSMLHVYSGYPPLELTDLQQVPCKVLVVQDEWHEAVAVPAIWQEVWQGARHGNLKERFRAFQLEP